MKKKIGLLLLMVAVVSVGAVFAKDGRKIPFEIDASSKRNPKGITIKEVKEIMTGIKITYDPGHEIKWVFPSLKEPGSIITFYFTALYEDGKKKEWKNVENYSLVRGSKSPSMTANLTNASKITSIKIYWIVIEAVTENEEKAQVLLDGIGYLDGIAGACADLQIASNVFENVKKVTSSVQKSIEYFNIYKNIKSSYDIAKQLKNAKTASEKERLRMELNMANLDWISSVGGKAGLQSKLLDTAVGGVKKIVKLSYERYTGYDWLWECAQHDSTLAEERYRPYFSLGLAMLERMEQQPKYSNNRDLIFEDIEKVFIALKRIDDAKKK